MCSDVDRNDKSRVCVPGSVQVIGRRLIESYAGVFHTVDHVEGTLAPGFDSLDAFLSHMWAVTIIGAPKKAAAQAIEDREKDARGWYGGAVGMLSLNGDINTGILIRTVHLKDSVARYPVGATLLYDSIPENEEQETRLKATGFFRSLRSGRRRGDATETAQRIGEGVKLLLVDNADCFIHTLANYARQTGAEVVTYRAGFPLELMKEIAPDIDPGLAGTGPSARFRRAGGGARCRAPRVSRCSVCAWGCRERWKRSAGNSVCSITPCTASRRYPAQERRDLRRPARALSRSAAITRLFAIREKLPSCLEVTAETEDGVIMGVRHKELPVEAVQFHPESMLSLEGNCGLRLIENVVRIYGKSKGAFNFLGAGGRH